MDLGSAVRARKMVRSFTGVPLDRRKLEVLLDLATRAPSAGNSSGREFVVLEGPDETARYWDATTTAEWRKGSRRFEGLSRAPVVVLVYVSPAKYAERYSMPDKATSGLGSTSGEAAWTVPYWYFDAGTSVMALLLGAVDAGLGACFLGNFRGEEQLALSLRVAAGWRFAGAVLLGEPAGVDPQSASILLGRPPSSDLVHYGSWPSDPQP